MRVGRTPNILGIAGPDKALPPTALKRRLALAAALFAALRLAPAGEEADSVARDVVADAEEIRLVARDRLSKGGPETAAALHGLFAHADARVRDAAADVARGRKDFAAFVPDLARLLRDPDSGNRWTAAYVLGKRGAESAEAAPELVRSMLEPELRNQVAAKWAVAALGEAAWPALVETLREPATPLAARAFARLSGPGVRVPGGDACARGALRRALAESPDAPVRRQAALVLRRLRLLGRDEEAALLRSALGDAAPDVRAAAAAALACVPEDRQEDVRRSLHEARLDPDPAVRTAVLKTLRALGATEEELR